MLQNDYAYHDQKDASRNVIKGNLEQGFPWYEDKQEDVISTETYQQMESAQDREVKNFKGVKRDIKVGQRVMVADYPKPNDRVWTEAEKSR